MNTDSYKPEYVPASMKSGVVYKYYECEAYKVLADPRSCYFCEHLTDIFYDYAHGPYGFVCSAGLLPDVDAIEGRCEKFKEEQ